MINTMALNASRFPLRFAGLSAAAGVALLVSACQGQTPAAPTPVPTEPPAPTVEPTIVIPTPVPTVAPTPTAAPTAALRLDANPFAVMIDNIAEARPHFGLGSADVVYEAPAEAGIPRLMPLYLRQNGEANRIGPVRSTRHYFVELANEYRAPLTHIGASPQGFDMLAETGLPDIDESRGDAGFMRDRSREAPHNAFVSTTSIRDSIKQKGIQTNATTGPLAFGEFKPGQDAAASVKISYPGPERYSVQYTYEASSKRYARVMDGQPHKDGSTGEQYTARSILIQYVDVEPIPNDPAMRVNVGLVGNGKGVLIADGTQVPLSWTKSSVREPTQFKRQDGSTFTVPEGQVWVQVVPLETQVAIS